LIRGITIVLDTLEVGIDRIERERERKRETINQIKPKDSKHQVGKTSLSFSFSKKR